MHACSRCEGDEINSARFMSRNLSADTSVLITLMLTKMITLPKDTVRYLPNIVTGAEGGGVFNVLLVGV